MQLVLDTRDIRISRERGVFLIEPPKGKPRRISPKKLSSIAITARVWLGADAVMLAIEHQLPILFFDRIGKAKARLWSPYFESIATLRRQQIRFQEGPKATRWMVELFELKTIHQIQLLQHLQRRNSRHKSPLQQATQKMEQQAKSLRSLIGQPIDDCRSRMMGVEGSIARVYWSVLGSALPRNHAFRKRSRRPAEDHFNAALNYLYGMLYSVVEAGTFAAGLDPHLGILHTDEHNKPTLAFDLIEPFRIFGQPRPKFFDKFESMAQFSDGQKQ